PSTFSGQATPDAVFIGGAVADAAVFEVCWSALRPGGRLVANAVTLEAEAHLIGLQAKDGGDLVRIDISTLDTIGAMHALRARRRRREGCRGGGERGGDPRPIRRAGRRPRRS